MIKREEIIENNIEILFKSLDFRKRDIEIHSEDSDYNEYIEYKEELYHIKKLIEIYQNMI